jgi:hypothetical protein
VAVFAFNRIDQRLSAQSDWWKRGFNGRQSFHQFLSVFGAQAANSLHDGLYLL